MPAFVYFFQFDHRKTDSVADTISSDYGDIKMRLGLTERLKADALRFLNQTTLAISVSDLAKNLNVSWSTARQILTELTLEGRIECQKTTNWKIYKPKENDR